MGHQPHGYNRRAAPANFTPRPPRNRARTSRFTPLRIARRLALPSANLLWKRRLILVVQLAPPSVGLGHPLRSPSITDASAHYRMINPAPGIGTLPPGFRHMPFQLSFGTKFSRFAPKPVSSSRRPIAGCRWNREHLSSRLLPERLHDPDSDSA